MATSENCTDVLKVQSAFLFDDDNFFNLKCTETISESVTAGLFGVAAPPCWSLSPVVGMGSWLLFHCVATLTVTSTCCSRAGWICDTRPQTTPELRAPSVCL